MHHVAIMTKSWNLIPKILSGEKTIESRWYQTRRTPWDKIRKGDTIFFKNSGETIIAQAQVSDVYQFQIHSITECRNILNKYGEDICLVNKDPSTWKKQPKYCILIHLENPRLVDTPFNIDKTGFGSGAAWITISDIARIKT